MVVGMESSNILIFNQQYSVEQMCQPLCPTLMECDAVHHFCASGSQSAVRPPSLPTNQQRQYHLAVIRNANQ